MSDPSDDLDALDAFLDNVDDTAIDTVLDSSAPVITTPQPKVVQLNPRNLSTPPLNMPTTPVTSLPLFYQQQMYNMMNMGKASQFMPQTPTTPQTPLSSTFPRGGITLMPFQYPLQQTPLLKGQTMPTTFSFTPPQRTIFTPMNSKALVDVTGKFGKNWPKFMGNLRADISLVNYQAWATTLQTLNSLPEEEAKKKPPVKVFITTEYPAVLLYSANREHIANVTNTQYNDCLIPLLREKIVMAYATTPTHNKRTDKYQVLLKLYIVKKAFQNDPAALQDLLAAEQGSDDQPEKQLDANASAMRVSLKELFDLLDNSVDDDDDDNWTTAGTTRKYSQIGGDGSASKLRKTGPGDVSKGRVDEDDLDDVDLDDELSEYINLDEVQQKGEEMGFKMELAKMYDAMTQELSDSESDDAGGSGLGSDSDFDSDWSEEEEEEDKKKKKKNKNSKSAPVEEISTPEILLAKLRPYQYTALRWMLNREKEGKDPQNTTPQLHSLFEERVFPDKSKYYYSSEIGVLTKVFLPEPPKPRGGILADEMGLGKTVEVISLICSNRMAEQHGSAPVVVSAKGDKKEKRYLSRATLVVTPLTIVDQWKHEIERHTSPPLKVYIYQGNRRLRDVLHLLQYDVIITTYNTLAFEYSQTYLNSNETRKKRKKEVKEPKEVQPSPMFQMEFFRVVLDEAHNIKNRKSLQARATAAVEANRRWAVTGTPIQNHIDDLFSLFHFLRVNPHGDWRWWSKNIGKPFEKKDRRAAEALQNVISELVIRRTKDKKINGQRIVMLPPKRIQLIELEFSAAEEQFYKSLYSYSKSKFDEFVQSNTVLKNYANILEMLLHLRQVCDHPALIINSFQKKSERSTMKGFLESFAKTCSFDVYDTILPMLPDVIKYNAKRESFKQDQLSKYGQFREEDVPSYGKINVPDFMKQHWRGSTKINSLVSYLKHDVKETTKSVVFSQWTSMLDLVEIALEKSGIRFVRLDGRMQRKDREIAVENFKNDRGVSVCLISLKVGGIGLNLVWATHVFLLDPWWNPAIEQQAIDRVHRIGQEEEVHVIRFVVKNSVEERIMALQKSKTKIASDALDVSNRDEENDADPDAESEVVADDEDDFETVDMGEAEEESAMLGGFGMTKKDAQQVRIKDLSTLFT